MQTEFEALDEATSAVIDELNKDRAKLAAEALQMRQERDEARQILLDVASNFDSLREDDGYEVPAWLESIRAFLAKAEVSR